MAKVKKPSKDKIPNKSIYSRLNYLYQAGTYLTTALPSPLSFSSLPRRGSDQPDVKVKKLEEPDLKDGHQSKSRGIRKGKEEYRQRKQYEIVAAAAAAAAAKISETETDNCRRETVKAPGLIPQSRKLLAEMRRVALKMQIRLDPSVKRTICKYCDTLILPAREGADWEGTTATTNATSDTTTTTSSPTISNSKLEHIEIESYGGSKSHDSNTRARTSVGTGNIYVENKSRGGRKPWADVIVVECFTCGRSRRFPVNAPRQLRKHLRPSGEARTQSSARTN